MRHRRQRRAWQIPGRRRTPGTSPALRAAVAAVLAAVLAVSLYAALRHSPQVSRRPPPPDALIARAGHYLGVSEQHEADSYQPANRFAQTIGRPPEGLLLGQWNR
jgi:hypothetical protein